MDKAVNFRRFMAIRTDKIGGGWGPKTRGHFRRDRSAASKNSGKWGQRNSLSLKPYFRGTPMTD